MEWLLDVGTSVKARKLRIGCGGVKDSKISDYEKSIIAGHYVMSDPEVIELKKKANSKIKDSRNDIDRILQSDIKKSIKRYMYYFRLIKNLN